MKKTHSLIVFGLVLAFGAFPLPVQGPQSLPLTLSFSYFGETISHPGLSMRLDCGLFEAGGYRLSLSGVAGWYLHPRNHEAFFVAGGVRNLLSSSFGLFGDLLLETGIISSAPAGTVYSIEGGTVQALPASRDTRFLLMAGLGGGWGFAGFSGLALAPYLRIGAFGEYPFNGYLYPHLFLESGLNMSF